MTQFTDLGLSAPVLKALAAEGYTTPTPIQAQAIPHVLAGKDVVGLAQTGTGKTAAFALPIIDRLAAAKKTPAARAARVLVLAPTRELAAQIGDSFRAYGKFSALTCAVVFGGVPIGRQIKALERGVDVLVATPGRLLDLIEQKKCRLDLVEILVLDEADHMLDLGFIHALKRIAQLVPAQRQTVFFSATMPPPIAELAKRFITDPVQVAVTPIASTAQRVEQAVIHVDQARKQDLLEDILRNPQIARGLVFTRTKHGADRVVKRLDAAGIDAQAIHGNKSQGQRERALEGFKKGRTRLLVATEIAARGIDVDDVTHVINFDLPDVPEQYVHRIGRTARAGATGEAISFCAPDERACLKAIEKLTRQPVPVLEHPLGLPTPGADAPVVARKRPG
ncbi:MAG: DEAD/DEAH box helicase, partial [Hyphomonadaceae bacterium]|nr:DEAD/DEAH box helicase [Hyphomonadaceae bacterium]